MIQLDYWLPGGQTFPMQQYQSEISAIHTRLREKRDAYTGWVDLPLRTPPELVRDLLRTASKIRNQCTALVIIGIGGSCLGAKACIELLQSPFYNESATAEQHLPRIYFAGHHVSTVYYTELLAHLSREEV